MITREEFYAKCDELQTPEDVKYILEQHKKLKRNKRIFIAIFLAIEIILNIFLYNLDASTYFLLLACVIFPASLLALIIGLVVISSNNQTDTSKKLKLKHSPEVINILLKDYQHSFSPNEYISQSVFKSSPFNSYYEDYTGEDLLSIHIPNDDGTPSKVVLHASDIEATYTEEYEDSEGNTKTRTVTAYRGLFGYVHFPFKFKCNLGLNCYSGKVKKIELEDMNFNKKFKTYTDDQLEAVVILTPTLMVKLLEFNERNIGFKCFLDKKGKLYFGITTNLFETNYPKPNESFYEIFRHFYNDIKTILEIVEEIKTNNKTFKM